MSDFYRVKEPFAYGNAVATAGEIWSGDNPAFKGREQFFEPIAAAASRTASRATETASAGPGETRVRRAPVKKAAPRTGPSHTTSEPEGGEN